MVSGSPSGTLRQQAVATVDRPARSGLDESVKALAAATVVGHAHLVLDGTLIPTEDVAALVGAAIEAGYGQALRDVRDGKHHYIGLGVLDEE